MFSCTATIHQINRSKLRYYLHFGILHAERRSTHHRLEDTRAKIQRNSITCRYWTKIPHNECSWSQNKDWHRVACINKLILFNIMPSHEIIVTWNPRIYIHKGRWIMGKSVNLHTEKTMVLHRGISTQRYELKRHGFNLHRISHNTSHNT